MPVRYLLTVDNTSRTTVGFNWISGSISAKDKSDTQIPFSSLLHPRCRQIRIRIYSHKVTVAGCRNAALQLQITGSRACNDNTFNINEVLVGIVAIFERHWTNNPAATSTVTDAWA